MTFPTFLLLIWLTIGVMFILLSTFKQGWVIALINSTSGWLVFFNTSATASYLIIQVFK